MNWWYDSGHSMHGWGHPVLALGAAALWGLIVLVLVAPARLRARRARQSRKVT